MKLEKTTIEESQKYRKKTLHNKKFVKRQFQEVDNRLDGYNSFNRLLKETYQKRINGDYKK